VKEAAVAAMATAAAAAPSERVRCCSGIWAVQGAGRGWKGLEGAGRGWKGLQRFFKRMPGL